MTRVEEIKKIVEGKKDVLVNLNDEIWATPELYFREEKSAAALIRVLKEQGFEADLAMAAATAHWVLLLWVLLLRQKTICRLMALKVQ